MNHILRPRTAMEGYLAQMRDLAPDVPPVLRVMVAAVLASPDIDADSLLFVAEGLEEAGREAALTGAHAQAGQFRALADLPRHRAPCRVRQVQDDFA